MASTYKFESTADGSPTLTPTSTQESNEPMHNKIGAFSETLFVYFDAVHLADYNEFPQSYLSIGLGLGYNELMIAAYLIKNKGQKSTDRASIHSFESDQWLVENFISWLKDEKLKGGAIWKDNYDQILTLTAQHFKCDPQQIKQTLLNLLSSGAWKISKALSRETTFDSTYSCILFDAYSEATCPELWSEDFIDYLLTQAAAKNCIFSTYAAKGTLNRQLRNHGFLLESKQGFGGKRQSTFAIRVHEIKGSKPLEL